MRSAGWRGTLLPFSGKLLGPFLDLLVAEEVGEEAVIMRADSKGGRWSENGAWECKEKIDMIGSDDFEEMKRLCE